VLYQSSGELDIILLPFWGPGTIMALYAFKDMHVCSHTDEMGLEGYAHVCSRTVSVMV